jgi:hypothetical protein
MTVNTAVSSPVTAGPGRPTKCTDVLIAEVARLVAEGNYMSTACELMGIDRGTADA